MGVRVQGLRGCAHGDVEGARGQATDGVKGDKSRGKGDDALGPVKRLLSDAADRTRQEARRPQRLQQREAPSASDDHQRPHDLARGTRDGVAKGGVGRGPGRAEDDRRGARHTRCDAAERPRPVHHTESRDEPPKRQR
nr:hypothetical protein [Pandoravirus belohorizontensis]